MNTEKLKLIADKWEKTGLLKGHDTESGDPIALASCLEAQMARNNESAADIRFKTISVPLIRRIFDLCEKRNHITLVNYFEENNEWRMPHYFKTRFNPPSQTEHFKRSGPPGFSLEAEANYVGELANDITNEITEAFSDLVNFRITFQGFDALPDGRIVMYYC